MASEIIVQTIKAPTSGANANKVIIPSGVTLDANAGDFRPPAGAVIQTLNNTLTAQTGTNSTSFVTTGLSVTITPKYANSKILITTSGTSYSEGDNLHQYHTIYRGSTNLGSSSEGMTIFSAASNTYGRWSNSGLHYLDSPNTTSAVTYTVYFKTHTSSGGTTYFVYSANHPHRMIVQEIAQ